MAKKKILVDIDMNQNEVQNAVIQNLASAPANPKSGQHYFNTADNTEYVWDGTAWVDALNQGRIYTGGDGIDITGNTIAIDPTVVARQSDIPTDNSELTNGAGYITGITGAMVTTALGYTPYNATNPNGYQANVIESIKVNGTAQTITAKAVDITVPTTAADVDALPDTTKYAASASMTINNTTYVVTLQLKDQDGNNIGTAQTIDLPLESMVVSGSYDSVNKKIVLTLKDGSTIDIPVADLIAGLQSEITSTNKLDADLVDDTTAAHKFVTAAQRTQIGTNASNITAIQNTIADFGDIVTHNASEFTKKLTTVNPALTASSGVCTWTITNTLGTADCIVSIREVSSNEEVACNVTYGGANIVVKINSASNIAANTYKATIIG